MVILCGLIGVGKSTLCKRIESSSDIQVFYEPADGNVYLKLFYAEPTKYAFVMQMYLLANRIWRFMHALSGKRVLMDRSYPDDRLFMNINYKNGNISEEERNIYISFYQLLDNLLFNNPANPLIQKITFVYLDAGIDVVQRRIMTRSRSCESGIPDSYHELLQNEYEAFLGDVEQLGGNVVYLPYNLDSDERQISHAVQTITDAAIPIEPLANRANVESVLNELCVELANQCEKRGIIYTDPRENTLNTFE